jgi:N-acetylglucosaminyl-diphospho-decaprenol L-rhamnosyltransferase
MGELCAVVVTQQGGERLAACVRSLQEQRPVLAGIVVVVSNPVAPPLPVGGEVSVLRPGRQLHYGEAVNLGAEAAVAESLLVLNDDTVARPGFIEALLAAHAEHPGALLQPRILLAGQPGLVENVGHGLFPDGHNQARGRSRADGAAFDIPGTVGAVSGAAFLAPRGRFMALGGFDAGLGPYGEDLDLSLRWVRAGGELRYVPRAIIEHELGASYGRASLGKIYRVERNRVRAAVRSLPVVALLGVPGFTVARWGLMAGAAAVGRGWGDQLPRGSSLAAVAGVVGGVLRGPEAVRKRQRDSEGWQRGEGAMLAHLVRNRARIVDFL